MSSPISAVQTDAMQTLASEFIGGQQSMVGFRGNIQNHFTDVQSHWRSNVSDAGVANCFTIIENALTAMANKCAEVSDRLGGVGKQSQAGMEATATAFHRAGGESESAVAGIGQHL